LRKPGNDVGRQRSSGSGSEAKELRTLEDAATYEADRHRFHSATHEEIAAGLTTDVYFLRTREILERMGLGGTLTTAEVFATRSGVMAGTEECLHLLRGRGVEVWAVDEGDEFDEKDVVLRIRGPYDAYGMYETVLLGMLAQPSGWAAAARECREAAGDSTVVCFAARHVHPSVAPVMERAALVGGIDGASCILGAKLADCKPTGTIPHALILIVGDTVEAANAYHRFMPEDAPRIILVDTFKDEAEESLRVAEALGDDLLGVRLDTPGERGGVTPWLVGEVRARLDSSGFDRVKIFVSGGMTPDRIRELKAAGADAFGVGSYISRAAPIDMTMDLKEIEGRPVAKRGRVPGLIENPKLKKRL